MQKPYLVDSYEFEDLAGAAYQICDSIPDEDEVSLFEFIQERWPSEYHKAMNLALKENYDSISLSHITDCIEPKDGDEFLLSLQEYVDSL
jgi:hypothetical protein